MIEISVPKVLEEENHESVIYGSKSVIYTSKSVIYGSQSPKTSSRGIPEVGGR